jgi:hypothetical protein
MSSGFGHDVAHWYALLPLPLPLPLPLRDQHGWDRHSQFCLDSLMAALCELITLYSPDVADVRERQSNSWPRPLLDNLTVLYRIARRSRNRVAEELAG